MLVFLHFYQSHFSVLDKRFSVLKHLFYFSRKKGILIYKKMESPDDRCTRISPKQNVKKRRGTTHRSISPFCLICVPGWLPKR
ncbi:hypothetical protein HMPREF3213_01725 [Heyndrickxia coagulans]|uniref:Uncharacterized protein n=1 Tax=Heyndrickxia coagulans TaxID=1398 RepID=A0A133KSH1_HEYCO|nr:hypothetical protein HMPREF3213_01725 [Heyndrickxia coagulans]